METSADFDLNRAIHDWRKELSKSPALQRDSLDELELHLRDSIVRLAEKGLSEDEAFLIAVRRCGTQKQLQTEFSKSGLIDRESWFFRIVWGLLGFLALLSAYSLWQAGAGTWGESYLGLGFPNVMLCVLAITGLNTFQLRSLAKARIQNPKLSALYWEVVLVFSASLILASIAILDIVGIAFFFRNATILYSLDQVLSGETSLLSVLFCLAQIMVLVFLLALSGISACVRKTCAR